MPLSVEQDETRCVVRLEGEIGVSEAVELKSLLLEGLVSGLKLHLNLERINEIDVSCMQLLYATLRETGRSGAGLAIRMSETAETALRSAGFGPCIESAGGTS